MGVSAADVEARLRSELAATDVQVQDIAGCVAWRWAIVILLAPSLWQWTGRSKCHCVAPCLHR